MFDDKINNCDVQRTCRTFPLNPKCAEITAKHVYIRFEPIYKVIFAAEPLLELRSLDYY